MTPELFTNITDMFTEPAALLNVEGVILATNRAFQSHVGLGPRDVTGMPLVSLVEGPATAVAEFVRTCSRTSDRVLGSLNVRQSNGAAEPTRCEGAVVGIIGQERLLMLRLISKDVAIGKFLLLNQRIEDLNREIARRQKAEAELRRQNQDKDDFLGMLAHELRNPLSPVLTGLHLLRVPGSHTAVSETLTMMERQLRHMARLVDDLLDVSRFTHGKIQLRREPIDLARLVQTAVSDHRGTCDAGGVTVAVDVPNSSVWVMGDATRLGQVVMNLLQNACKFTERGGQVDVRLEIDSENKTASIRVLDTGIGISHELLGRVFEPFSQGDQSLDRANGGLGLGLALVKKLSELHGGSVVARSSGPGTGSEFIVRLPLEEPAAISEPEKSSPPPGEGLRILIVEDNRDGAESLRLFLQMMGHEVRVAYTGPDGVATADEWRPNVVLCDIGLPGLDGYGVADRLHQISVASRSRLIAITGYGSPEDLERCRQHGFHAHLVKPADPQRLLALLANDSGR